MGENRLDPITERFDLLIRSGTIIDGTGQAGFVGDVAIRDGRIVSVASSIAGFADEVLDATGKIVTPGFIDVHTHYDAQVSWDGALEPSSSHGVTTVVMGNCGVGFAPVRPTDHDMLIDLMEGVEDIPGTALHEGLTWDWESFPDYMEAVGRRAFALDVAAQIPHAPLRLYVMGDRGGRNEPATTEDMNAMAALVREGLKAGAVGFSTSRVLEHQTAAGLPVAGTYAAEDEMFALACAVRDAGRGIFQSVPTGAVGGVSTPESKGRLVGEIEMLGRIALETGVPVIFSLLQAHDEPDNWRSVVKIAEQVCAAGGQLRPQVAARAPGALSTLSGYHPFQRRESYLKLAHLPFRELLAAMRKPETRQAILTDRDIAPESTAIMANRHIIMQRGLAKSYVYGQRVDFEPEADQSLGGQAAAAGKDLQAVAYDALLENDGLALLFNLPLNYANGDYGDVAEMLANPVTLSGLSDAGGHVRVICDGSMPTFMMTFWARDRTRGRTFPMEFIIKKQTADNADVYGFEDRGRIATGLRADINIIDLDKLTLGHPRMEADLPKGGQRLLQGATGYVATLVAGIVTRRNDRDTGARPGRLIRNAGFHRSVALPCSAIPAVVEETVGSSNRVGAPAMPGDPGVPHANVER